MKTLLRKLSVYERTLLGVLIVVTLLLAAADVYLEHRDAVHLKVVKVVSPK